MPSCFRGAAVSPRLPFLSIVSCHRKSPWMLWLEIMLTNVLLKYHLAAVAPRLPFLSIVSCHRKSPWMLWLEIMLRNVLLICLQMLSANPRGSPPIFIQKTKFSTLVGHANDCEWRENLLMIPSGVNWRGNERDVGKTCRWWLMDVVVSGYWKVVVRWRWW